uniref:GPI ethanolamine phosphate transferase 2 C-terminal domain-containing protein n=1 Tax=Timema cristinae TaxID=61476 RepID=A0A7R9CFI7_TIMCR|nr:unnamed protein product [Timema cristinae]
MVTVRDGESLEEVSYISDVLEPSNQNMNRVLRGWVFALLLVDANAPSSEHVLLGTLLSLGVHSLGCFLGGGNSFLCCLGLNSGFFLAVFTAVVIAVNSCVLTSCWPQYVELCRKFPRGDMKRFLLLGTVLHSVSLASSSFIEEEHQVWYFLFLTFSLVTLACLYKSLMPSEALYGGFLLVLHRILRKMNQTGDKWASLPDIGDWLVQPGQKTFLTAVFLLGQSNISVGGGSNHYIRRRRVSPIYQEEEGQSNISGGGGGSNHYIRRRRVSPIYQEEEEGRSNISGGGGSVQYISGRRRVSSLYQWEEGQSNISVGGGGSVHYISGRRVKPLYQEEEGQSNISVGGGSNHYIRRRRVSPIYQWEEGQTIISGGGGSNQYIRRRRVSPIYQWEEEGQFNISVGGGSVQYISGGGGSVQYISGRRRVSSIYQWEEGQSNISVGGGGSVQYIRRRRVSSIYQWEEGQSNIYQWEEEGQSNIYQEEEGQSNISVGGGGSVQYISGRRRVSSIYQWEEGQSNIYQEEEGLLGVCVSCHYLNTRSSRRDLILYSIAAAYIYCCRAATGSVLLPFAYPLSSRNKLSWHCEGSYRSLSCGGNNKPSWHCEDSYRSLSCEGNDKLSWHCKDSYRSLSCGGNNKPSWHCEDSYRSLSCGGNDKLSWHCEDSYRSLSCGGNDKPSWGVTEVMVFWGVLCVLVVKSVVNLWHTNDSPLGVFTCTCALVSALLHRPHTVLLVPAQVLCSAHIHRACLRMGVRWNTIAHIWLGWVFYFYQGNSNSLASIDVASGYVGLERYSLGTVGLQLVLHTYSAPILSHMLLINGVEHNARKGVFPNYQLFLVLVWKKMERAVASARIAGQDEGFLDESMTAGVTETSELLKELPSTSSSETSDLDNKEDSLGVKAVTPTSQPSWSAVYSSGAGAEVPPSRISNDELQMNELRGHRLYNPLSDSKQDQIWACSDEKGIGTVKKGLTSKSVKATALGFASQSVRPFFNLEFKGLDVCLKQPRLCFRHAGSILYQSMVIVSGNIHLIFRKHLVDVYATSLYTRVLPLATFCSLVIAQRYHLFVWSVFSPKLLYETMHTIVIFTLLVVTEVCFQLANALVVLSSTAEDGEIEVRISVG